MDYNNLDIALSHHLDPRLGWPSQFKHNHVDQSRLKKYKANILTGHTVLNLDELKKVMFQPSKLFTIIREPAEQFVSFFYYEKLDEIFNLKGYPDPVETVLKNVSKYITPSFIKKYYSYSVLLKNGMTYDLNYHGYLRANTNGTTFTDYIKYIDSSFDFILLTEYFDESLLLLRKHFCWSMLDIVYQSKLVNAARPKVSSTVKHLVEKHNGST